MYYEVHSSKTLRYIYCDMLYVSVFMCMVYCMVRAYVCYNIVTVYIKHSLMDTCSISSVSMNVKATCRLSTICRRVLGCLWYLQREGGREGESNNFMALSQSLFYSLHSQLFASETLQQSNKSETILHVFLEIRHGWPPLPLQVTVGPIHEGFLLYFDPLSILHLCALLGCRYRLGMSC